jgi:hypothetical protein
MIQKRTEELENIIKQEFAERDEYTALFALQTAYVIIIKLISYRIISEPRFEISLKNYNSIVPRQ